MSIPTSIKIVAAAVPATTIAVAAAEVIDYHAVIGSAVPHFIRTHACYSYLRTLPSILYIPVPRYLSIAHRMSFSYNYVLSHNKYVIHTLPISFNIYLPQYHTIHKRDPSNYCLRARTYPVVSPFHPPIHTGSSCRG